MNFLEIVDKYDLKEYVKIILTHNKGNYNPYHNFYHMETMIERSYLIALDNDIDEYNMRVLFISILFHDFNHSGGLYNDSLNVKIAIESFLSYSHESEAINEYVIDLINFTEFPYSDKKAVTILHSIIRDSDLLQFTDKNFIQMIILGLKKELNKNLDINIIKEQLSFMKKIKDFISTKKGIEIYNEHINEKNKECELLLKIL